MKRYEKLWKATIVSYSIMAWAAETYLKLDSKSSKCRHVHQFNLRLQQIPSWEHNFWHAPNVFYWEIMGSDLFVYSKWFEEHPKVKCHWNIERQAAWGQLWWASEISSVSCHLVLWSAGGSWRKQPWFFSMSFRGWWKAVKNTLSIIWFVKDIDRYSALE